MEHRSSQRVGWRHVDVVAIAAALFLVAGCTDSTAPVAIARIEPATSTVILQHTPQGQVLTTSVIVTNTTPFDVSYLSCGVSMEKAGLPALPPGKSEWQTVWVRYCALLDASSSFTSAVLRVEVLQHHPPDRRGRRAAPVVGFQRRTRGISLSRPDVSEGIRQLSPCAVRGLCVGFLHAAAGSVICTV
jgi:hypothetical protein